LVLVYCDFRQFKGRSTPHCKYSSKTQTHI
jgi:hypothetical protein